MTTTTVRFSCPLCGSSSPGAEDVEFGYCGACHAFTGDLSRPLIVEQPLVIWVGATTATVATLQPCEDPRPQILAALRQVVAVLERQVDVDEEQRAAEVIGDQADDVAAEVDEPHPNLINLDTGEVYTWVEDGYAHEDDHDATWSRAALLAQGLALVEVDQVPPDKLAALRAKYAAGDQVEDASDA